MALTRWKKFEDILFIGSEMDPVYEDYLAQALNKCEEPPIEEYPYHFPVEEKGIKERVLDEILEPA